MSNCCTDRPESAQARSAKNCPECGAVGKPVKTITLKHMVKPHFLAAVDKPGFLFCATPGCDVVYFHSEDKEIRKEDIRVRVGLKETDDPVPLCYCFGFTQAMIAREIRETGDFTLPQRISAEIKAGNCACEVRNPQGSCCLGNIAASVKRLSASPTDPVRAAIPDRGRQRGVVHQNRLLSRLAISGAGIFAIAEFVQPFYRSDRTLSDPYGAYAIGKYGFVQTIAFIALSAGSFALLSGLSSFGRATSSWRFGRIFLGVWSVGVLMAAIFPMKGGPGPASSEVHGLASMLSFLGIILAMFALSKFMESHAKWRAFARASWLLALVGAASFAMAAAVHHSVCFAVMQRVFLSALVLWICMTGARLRSLNPD